MTRLPDAAGGASYLRGQKPWALLAPVLPSERPLTRRELGAELFPKALDPLDSVRRSLADVAVIGVPDDRWGDVRGAVVVPWAGASLDAADLVAGCRERQVV